MHWLYLIAAGFFECGFTTCLKLSDGLTKLGWSVAFVLLSIVSFGLLTLAAQKIPLGTAYAVWTGIGAVGTALIGIIWFKDPAHLLAAVLPHRSHRLPHRAEARFARAGVNRGAAFLRARAEVSHISLIFPLTFSSSFRLLLEPLRLSRLAFHWFDGPILFVRAATRRAVGGTSAFGGSGRASMSFLPIRASVRLARAPLRSRSR